MGGQDDGRASWPFEERNDMTEDSNLVPQPQASILDTASRALGSEELGRQAVVSPQSVGALADVGADHSTSSHRKENEGESGITRPDLDTGIPLTAVDDIGRATAEDVREALHQVIDPELGIDVVDLGLVYGIEIDERHRAIITMTLTTPACPLTDLLEDQCASVLAGLVEEFRIDWTWTPQWTIDKILPEGREQLEAIGFNFANMPKY